MDGIWELDILIPVGHRLGKDKWDKQHLAVLRRVFSELCILSISTETTIVGSANFQIGNRKHQLYAVV